MPEDISRYLPVTKFIAEIMGPDTEVILYSVSDRCVYHVINPMDDEMVVGSEMRALERSFLENRLYEREDFVVNYRALSKRKNKLKSATLFLRGDDRLPIAMLTVNANVDRLVELRDMLNEMVSGHHPYDDREGTSFYNSFDVSVEGIVSTTIQKELDKYKIPPDRLSQQEKLEIVRNLDQQGIFLVKGAIAELAGVLRTTETTIYRYLNKLSSEK
ncbi:MAG: helix-turn-helix domain-containing protein [Clostridiales bacterium]|nr:helix-turn-helix domain-containing protein [Clostridiales bacterium]